VRSVGELVEAIERIRSQRRVPLWYRGQRDATWSVTPALWRTTGPRPYTLEDERNFTHRFRTRAAVRYPNTPRYDDHSAWLSLMQHYGLPTRLLDWSRSPLVAAYFAVESYLQSNTWSPCDAAIWVLSPHELNRMHAAVDVTPAINSRDCEHLVEPAFRDHSRTGNSRRRGSLIAAMATELDLRMFVQQGCFTVHAPNTGPLESPSVSDGILWCLKIRYEFLHSFAQQMDNLGFRAGDLFPDLQNLANELVRSYPPGSVGVMKE
jgi:hypothetical protein